VKIEQRQWTSKNGWMRSTPSLSDHPDLVLVFGARDALSDPTPLAELRAVYGSAHVIGCSTAGEICDVDVQDESIVATAIRFERSRVETGRVKLDEVASSYEAGAQLAAHFDPKGLVHLFVLSDGLLVNGSELVQGLTQGLPPGVAVTGGLSGDGARFQKTLVCLDSSMEPGAVAAVALYGESLRVGYASLGGWDPFGPERLVTRSTANVLHELDGRSALALYKDYLGTHAADLPASGLLFPLSLRGENGQPGVVRTILGVDEANQSMTFAGDIREGSYVRFMKANFDRLIEGASEAARNSSTPLNNGAELAILISCVGRKLILQQRIEEEVEGVREVLGEKPLLTGFYSYGEISPFAPTAKCELHNQTMTITTLAEV
jgi:hypothetical protein